MVNNNGTEVDLASYKNQSSLPRDYCDAGATASNVKTLAVHIISVYSFVYSIKACFQHVTSLFSRTHQI